MTGLLQRLARQAMGGPSKVRAAASTSFGERLDTIASDQPVRQPQLGRAGDRDLSHGAQRNSEISLAGHDGRVGPIEPHRTPDRIPEDRPPPRGTMRASAATASIGEHPALMTTGGDPYAEPQGSAAPLPAAEPGADRTDARVRVPPHAPPRDRSAPVRPRQAAADAVPVAETPAPIVTGDASESRGGRGWLDASLN